MKDPGCLRSVAMLSLCLPLACGGDEPTSGGAHELGDTGAELDEDPAETGDSADDSEDQAEAETGEDQDETDEQQCDPHTPEQVEQEF
ncbi:MAG TPA: hypothetical protein VK034_31050, partial [Enhygromyxa sp.]|nr:hypothetical protein [Enhygromyxa sp.]